MGLFPGGASERRSCPALGLVPGRRAGGGGLAVARLAGPVLSPLSLQMQLLLVKRGSALPFYLRLVTDHLRLFTLFEQVSGGHERSLFIFEVLIPLPSLHSASFSHPHPLPSCDHPFLIHTPKPCFSPTSVALSLSSLRILFSDVPSPTHNQSCFSPSPH